MNYYFETIYEKDFGIMATDSKKPAKTLAPVKPKKPTKSKKPTVAFKNLLAQTFPRYW